MSVLVVDELEAVEIEKGETERKCGVKTDVEFTAERVIEMTHVVEACGVVCDSELLDARVIVGVFDGDGGVIGEDMQEGDGVVIHLPGARIENFNDSEGAGASLER